MFVELHAKSAFPFLEAAVLPEALAGRAALGQPALALVDQGGVYGAPHFYGACTRLGITPLVGAEVGMRDGRIVNINTLRQRWPPSRPPSP